MQEKIRKRGFFVLTGAELTGVIGDVLYNIVFLIYATQQENKFLCVSIAGILPFIPRVLNFYSGYLADRIKRPFKSATIFKITQIIMFLVVAAVIEHPSLIVFLLISVLMVLSDFLGNLYGGVFIVAEKDSLHADEREAYMGYLSGITSAIYLIFQSAGVGLLTVFHNDFTLIALINAFTIALSLGILWAGRKYLPASAFNKKVTTQTEESSEQTQVNGMVAGAKLLWSFPEIKTMIILIITINFLGAIQTPVLNLTYTQLNAILINHSVSFTILAVSLSLGIGELIGGFSLGTPLHKIKLLQLMPMNFIMYLLSAVAVFLANWPLLLFTMFILGFVQGMFNPKFNAWFMNNVPEDNFALVSGMMTTCSMFAIPVGQVVGMSLVGLGSIYIGWTLLGILGLLAAIGAIYVNKNYQVNI